MSKHDAEYFRQRRRAQGIPERDPFSGRKFLQQAIELRRLEQLPWPRNLFGMPASIAELMAMAAQLSEQPDNNPDDVCPCGCRREHKHNGSCPMPWCRSEAPEQRWLRVQAATAGRLTLAVSLTEPRVSRLM